MRLFMLIALCIYLNNSFAQDASVYKRLNGVPLKSVLKVNYSENGFTYIPDDDAEDQPSPLHDNVFNISNTRKNIMFVWLKFYNPLKYKVNFSVKEIDDPNLVALKSAIDSFQPYSPPTSAPSSTTIASINTNARSRPIVKPDSLTRVEEFNSSRIMFDWIDNFMQSVDLVKVANNSDKYNQLVQSINDIGSVENFLYGKLTIEGGENTIEKWVQLQTSHLNSKDTLANFISSLKISERVVTRLDEHKNKSLADINKISKLLTDGFSEIAFFLKTVEEKRFKIYSAGKRFSLENIIISAIQSKAEAIDKLREINKKSRDFLKQFNDKGYMTCYVHEFNWDYDKMREYTFTGTTTTTGTTDPKTQSATFTVGKDQALAVFASTGVFYTPFSFNNFGIQDGLAVSTKPTAVYARPAAYLNMMFKRKKGDILYWLLQVGVSVGNETPMFPVGGGIVLRNNFSLSGGPLLVWQNKLSGIELNDPVDDAILKNSIIKRLDSSWYISINYKLGK